MGASEIFWIDVAVEAEDRDVAQERAYEWLEKTLKSAQTWRRETDIVFDDERDDDYEGRSWEIAQLFGISGISKVDGNT